MTGRRLYDHFTDTTRDQRYGYGGSVLPGYSAPDSAPPTAWAFLSDRDRRVWNDLARRITPKRAAR